MVTLEDAIRLCLSESCFEEIDEVGKKMEEDEIRFKQMLGIGSGAEISDLGQSLAGHKQHIEAIANGEMIPAKFWIKIAELIKPEILRIADTSECPETILTIGQDLGKIKLRHYQRVQNKGGRPANTRLFVDGVLMSKADFARKFDPQYADSPETSMRMSWHIVRRLCRELLQNGKIYVARIESKDEYGNWSVTEVIGG